MAVLVSQKKAREEDISSRFQIIRRGQGDCRRRTWDACGCVGGVRRVAFLPRPGRTHDTAEVRSKALLLRWAFTGETRWTILRGAAKLWEEGGADEVFFCSVKSGYACVQSYYTSECFVVLVLLD